MAQELMVDVHGPEISVSVRGTCLKTTYWKGNAPWVVCTELRADDHEAIFTHAKNSGGSLGLRLMTRPARWAGLFSRSYAAR